jgi:hypothetical protein
MLEQDRRASGLVRAADRDRESTASLLKRHHLEGRLDAHEFEQRLQNCLSARTLGDLRVLVLDLPHETERGEKPVRSNLRWVIAAFVITVVLVATSLATGARLFFPAPLVFFAVARFGPWHWRRARRHRWTDDGVVGA